MSKRAAMLAISCLLLLSCKGKKLTRIYGTASADATGATISADVGLKNASDEDFDPAGTLAIGVTGADGKVVCATSITMPAGHARSPDGLHRLSGAASPPCPPDTGAARSAKLVFTTANGDHAALVVPFHIVKPLVPGSFPTEAPKATGPTPWDPQIAATIAKQLPPADAPDTRCPDSELRAIDERERKEITAVFRDQLLAAAKLPSTNKDCRPSIELTGTIPRLFYVVEASACTLPKLVDETHAVAGSFRGLLALVDSQKKKVLCHAQLTAKSSGSTTAEAKYGSEAAIDYNFFQQLSTQQSEAAKRMSGVLERP